MPDIVEVPLTTVVSVALIFGGLFGGALGAFITHAYMKLKELEKRRTSF